MFLWPGNLLPWTHGKVLGISRDSFCRSPCPEPQALTAQSYLHLLKHQTPFRPFLERRRWCFLPQSMVIFADLVMSPLRITNLSPASILVLGGLRDTGCCFLFWLSSRSDFLLPLMFSAAIKGGVRLQGTAAMCSFRLFSSIIYHCILAP